jgi:hypothetical protein
MVRALGVAVAGGRKVADGDGVTVAVGKMIGVAVTDGVGVTVAVGEAGGGVGEDGTAVGVAATAVVVGLRSDGGDTCSMSAAASGSAAAGPSVAGSAVVVQPTKKIVNRPHPNQNRVPCLPLIISICLAFMKPSIVH